MEVKVSDEPREDQGHVDDACMRDCVISVGVNATERRSCTAGFLGGLVRALQTDHSFDGVPGEGADRDFVHGSCMFLPVTCGQASDS